MQHTPTHPSSTHTLPSHLHICNFRDPQWANEYIIDVQVHVYNRQPVCPPHDREAYRSMPTAEAELCICCLTGTETSKGTMVMRKRMAVIRQLFKRDSAGRMPLIPWPHQARQAIKEPAECFCADQERGHWESSAAPSAAAASPACGGRHRDEHRWHRGDS